MKKICLLFALLVSSSMLHAEPLLETYVARLGTDDHFNSKGARLRSVAAIIRQDRANFHKFGIRDFEDQGDRFFSSKSNRARLEAMLNKGFMSKQTRSAIVNGTPVITVNIYSDYIEVFLQ